MSILSDNITFVEVWTPKRIQQLRHATGMTQVQFADWLGVTRNHVAHLETGFRLAGPQTVRLLDLLSGRKPIPELRPGDADSKLKRKGGNRE